VSGLNACWSDWPKARSRPCWYSLWDKVWSQDNLNQAILKVIHNRGSAGVDRYTTEQLKTQWAQQGKHLQEELKGGSYQPKAARRVWIPKLGSTELRPLGIPAVRDRVVQTAVRAVLEPIFERDFAEQSYGFRPKRSTLAALERVESLLRRGYTWIVDADLKSYFDTIPQERLMQLVKQRIADGRVLGLLEQYLKAGVMDSLKAGKPRSRGRRKAR